MYNISPPAIYIFDEVYRDDQSLERTKKMLAAIHRSLADAKRVTEADIPEMIRENGWQDARVRQGMLGEHTDPSLVFTKLQFGDAPDITEILGAFPTDAPERLIRTLVGDGGKRLAAEGVNSGRGVCRARYQFDTIYGCPHGCRYCAGGKVAVIFTNVEEFIEKQVIPTAEQNRWQKVFMYNSNLSDTPCFEPEYGLSKLLAEYYATTVDQHYLIHTKSANVDYLRDIDHQGHTIVLWSITSDTVSRIVEPGSATTEERIEAVRTCQEAGYPVRVKFKPIVPVRNWRAECSQMIEALFARTRPDNVGLCSLAWMDAAELKTLIDGSLLDPEYIRIMNESAESMKGDRTGPFPHRVRAEMYEFYLNEIRKHDADIPVFLCTESPDMWREFAPRLGMNPGNYVCGCGPQSAPGMKRIETLRQPAELS